jgi:hypothetical protein
MHAIQAELPESAEPADEQSSGIELTEHTSWPLAPEATPSEKTPGASITNGQLRGNPFGTLGTAPAIGGKPQDQSSAQQDQQTRERAAREIPDALEISITLQSAQLHHTYHIFQKTVCRAIPLKKASAPAAAQPTTPPTAPGPGKPAPMASAGAARPRAAGPGMLPMGMTGLPGLPGFTSSNPVR